VIGAGDRALEAGDVVGEYVIERQLGQGGFGTVYLARHPLIGKEAAIKVLSRRYSSDETVVSRFVAEARAVNQIRHRNIVDIFSFGQLGDGRHYYVMEYLEGTPLDRYLKEHGALSLDRALPILRAIARALDAAHHKGIAHRDLKPENIVLTFDDEGQIFPKLLDFGIAKLTAPEQEQAHRTGTGVPLGTPFYMSPEQCRGRDVDHRTDIYSFGVLTFRLLTGDYPFHGELIEILHKHMHDEPPAASSINPALSPATDRAIRQMMAKDAAERPPSAMSAVVALQGEGGTTPAITPSAMRSVPPMTRGDAMSDTLAAAPTPVSIAPLAMPAAPAPAKARVVWFVGGGVGLAAIGVLAWTKLGGTEPPPPTATPAPAPAVTPAPAPARPPEPAPPVPAPVSKRVILTFEGAPPGATVSVGGKAIGYVPSVELDRGPSALVVTLALDGYFPTPIEVTPDRNQSLAVTMKKKPRPAARPNKDDILPFPKEK
jgi:eukaryotic-like serine/threonine-protein kinase